jgi:surface antigen
VPRGPREGAFLLVKISVDNRVSVVHNLAHMRAKGRFQDVRLAHVPTSVVRRLKTALMSDGEESLVEWFTKRAIETATAFENRMKYGRKT